jgi:dTMP kinase
MTGKFITFEGIDGSGKSTISQQLYEYLKAAGTDVVLTQEPTDTWRGQMVTRAVEEYNHPLTIALAFMADRNEHVKQIKKWLQNGKLVLCDRYIDSTFAYQSIHLSDHMENPLEWLRIVHAPFYLEPDITFLFLLDPEIAVERIKRETSAFENTPFLKDVQEQYIHLADKHKRFITIDATREIRDLVKECLDVITENIN